MLVGMRPARAMSATLRLASLRPSGTGTPSRPSRSGAGCGGRFGSSRSGRRSTGSLCGDRSRGSSPVRGKLAASWVLTAPDPPRLELPSSGLNPEARNSVAMLSRSPCTANARGMTFESLRRAIIRIPSAADSSKVLFVPCGVKRLALHGGKILVGAIWRTPPEMARSQIVPRPVSVK